MLSTTSPGQAGEDAASGSRANRNHKVHGTRSKTASNLHEARWQDPQIKSEFPWTSDSWHFGIGRGREGEAKKLQAEERRGREAAGSGGRVEEKNGRYVAVCKTARPGSGEKRTRRKKGMEANTIYRTRRLEDIQKMGGEKGKRKARLEKRGRMLRSAIHPINKREMSTKQRSPQEGWGVDL